MNVIAPQEKIYSLYVSDKAIELRFNGDQDFKEGRLICSQKNYDNILEFGLKLSQHKRLPLINRASPRWVEVPSLQESPTIVRL